MPPTFVEQDEYYDVSTAWPSSLTLVGAPAGTARGDRLLLVVLAYNTTTTLDNWNVSADWDFVDSENGTTGVGGSRSSIHVYTARHQDGAPLPLTISPRTSGGTLITSPGGGAWYRAHLYAVTPSHPVQSADVARGQTVADQPDGNRDGFSLQGGDYLIQLTAVLNPETRTLGAITSPGGAIGTYTERATMAAVSARGGAMSIADVIASSTFTGDPWALYALGGSGGSINVRSVLTVLDADPDPDLPPIFGGAGIYVDGAVHL